MPKSKELLESDDSYDSDEVKPRAKKQKVSVKKESVPAPTAKNGKKKTEEDEDNENEDAEEVETKPVKSSSSTTSTSKKSQPKAEAEDEEGEEEDDVKDGRYSLGKLRFVNVSEFRGKALVNIREYYEKDGKTLPGKKGISLSLEQWEKLKSLIGKIDKDVKKLK